MAEKLKERWNSMKYWKIDVKCSLPNGIWSSSKVNSLIKGATGFYSWSQVEGPWVFNLSKRTVPCSNRKPLVLACDPSCLRGKPSLLQGQPHFYTSTPFSLDFLQLKFSSLLLCRSSSAVYISNDGFVLLLTLQYKELDGMMLVMGPGDLNSVLGWTHNISRGCFSI